MSLWCQKSTMEPWEDDVEETHEENSTRPDRSHYRSQIRNKCLRQWKPWVMSTIGNDVRHSRLYIHVLLYQTHVCQKDGTFLYVLHSNAIFLGQSDESFIKIETITTMTEVFWDLFSRQNELSPFKCIWQLNTLIQSLLREIQQGSKENPALAFSGFFFNKKVCDIEWEGSLISRERISFVKMILFFAKPLCR